MIASGCAINCRVPPTSYLHTLLLRAHSDLRFDNVGMSARNRHIDGRTRRMYLWKRRHVGALGRVFVDGMNVEKKARAKDT